MLRCAMCDKPLRECCDIFETAYDAETGEEVVLCGECAVQVEAQEDDDVKQKSEKKGDCKL